MIEEYKSIKSNSTFTAEGTERRAFVKCAGEASNIQKVNAEIERIRKGSCDFATAAWTARMLSRTY